MTILNVGYGTTNPQQLLHLVQNNATIILQDNRTDESSSTNIEFINGIENFGENPSKWKLSNSNSMFCIKRSLDNITCNVLTLEENGNMNVSKDIILSGNIIKNNVNVIDDIYTYISSYTESNIDLISSRITNLITDSIIENKNSSNKFIVNNLYNNNLTVNGSVIINSNLTVLGETTYLYTDVYTTEQLIVNNEGNGVAFDLTQKIILTVS